MSKPKQWFYLKLHQWPLFTCIICSLFGKLFSKTPVCEIYVISSLINPLCHQIYFEGACNLQMHLYMDNDPIGECIHNTIKYIYYIYYGNYKVNNVVNSS